MDPASIAEAIAGKQDLLIFDSQPVAGSHNPVTSDGIAQALSGKQNAMTFDSAPTAGSSNPVTSDGLKRALDGKQNQLVIDGAPVSGSSHPITSGGVHAALADKQNRLFFDDEPTRGSNNVLSSGVVYEALQDVQIPVDIDDAPTQNSDNLVSSGAVYLALSGMQDKIWSTTVSLTANWSGNDPYTQVITIPKTTAHSMVELQPGIAAIRRFKQDGVDAMWVENNNGVFTVYALGAAPTAALDIQCVIIEVGNTSSVSEEPVITVDATLSPSSGNPVQNKVIYSALEEKEAVDNKVTQITGSCTDTEYPSAKAVWALFNSLADGDGRSY